MPDALHEVAPAATESAIEGRIDAIQGGRVYGWAWDRAHPADRLEVEFRAEGPDGSPLVLGRAVADRAREDLVGGGYGDGQHAFEAAIDLPPGLEPARVVAVVHAPSTGTIQTFVQPSADEQLLQRTLAPHLLRIADGVEASRRDQQRLASSQQGLARLLRDMHDRIAANREDANREDKAQQAELLDAFNELKERVGSLEVFLVRMDASMRNLDEALKAKVAPNNGPMIAAALGAGIGALVATIIGLALFG
ncbi:hypothetical protein [Azospirillum soli]|uniref:hypothetical protein n=1 Tax=Azospirillum soli TaxID=1304799 RepID=UPI001AE3A2E2|nr:hypothetical protein [Azospirillum soli]MBP2314234.1 hypothetical protein [Azospirillum soli]